MPSLDDYASEVQSMSRDAFVAAHPRPVLVLDLAPQHRLSWSFKTVRITKDLLSGRKITTRPRSEFASVRVLELQKGRAHTWGDRISVGRAPNNDISLNDSSVSKLHACFTFDAQGVLITDMDSANGTSVGGVLIPANTPQRLNPGDTIAFGAVSVKLMQSGELYDFVKNELGSHVE